MTRIDNPVFIASFRWSFVLAISVGAISTTSNADPALITIGAPQHSGDILTFPITMSGDFEGEVSAMDFQLQYDSRELRPMGINASRAAVASNKEVQANVVGPGQYKVLLFGFNQTPLGQGEIANVQFRIMSEPQDGKINLSIANTTVSQSNATAIPSRGDSFTYQIGEENPDDAEEPNEENQDEESTPLPVVEDNPGVRGPAGFSSDVTRNGASMTEARSPASPSAPQNGSAGSVPTNRDALARALEEVQAKRDALPEGGTEEQEAIETPTTVARAKSDARLIRVTTNSPDTPAIVEEEQSAPLAKTYVEVSKPLLAGGVAVAILLTLWALRRAFAP